MLNLEIPLLVVPQNPRNPILLPLRPTSIYCSQISLNSLENPRRASDQPRTSRTLKNREGCVQAVAFLVRMSNSEPGHAHEGLERAFVAAQHKIYMYIFTDIYIYVYHICVCMSCRHSLSHGRSKEKRAGGKPLPRRLRHWALVGNASGFQLIAGPIGI